MSHQLRLMRTHAHRPRPPRGTVRLLHARRSAHPQPLPAGPAARDRGAPLMASPARSARSMPSRSSRSKGMDCHEEVAILEKRLEEARRASRRCHADVLSQRLTITVRRREAEHLRDRRGRGADRHARVARARAADRRRPVRRDAARCSWSLSGVLVGARHGARVRRRSTGASSSAAYAARDRQRRHLQRAPRAARGALAGARHQRPDARRRGRARWSWASGAKGRSVVFLFALAQLLEARAMERARGAIRALMDLTPAEALVRDAASGALPPRAGGRHRGRRHRRGQARREDSARRPRRRAARATSTRRR